MPTAIEQEQISEVEEPVTYSPIVEEIYRIRDERAARYNYDVRALADDLLRAQEQSGRSFARLPIRRRDVDEIKTDS